jgi:hypothetical protein
MKNHVVGGGGGDMKKSTCSEAIEHLNVLFYGEHLRCASTNMGNTLGHEELHSSTNRKNYEQSTLDNFINKL